MVSKESRAKVSDHVIVRWLERVEGYNFDDVREDLKCKEATDSQILDYLANKYGLFRGHVVFRIATKQVRNAMKLGAKKVNRGDWTLVLRNGCVVTLLPRSNAKARAFFFQAKKQRNGD